MVRLPAERSEPLTRIPAAERRPVRGTFPTVPAVVALICGFAGSLHGRPPPPHRDAFAAAWRAVRACLVGSPPWSADLDRAREIQRALGAGDCAAKIATARRVAAEGADGDATYHLAWYRAGAAVAKIDPRYGAGELPKLEANLIALVGIPPSSTAIAQPPLLPNVGPPHRDSAGATDVEISAPWDHKLNIAFHSGGFQHLTGTDGPDPKSVPDNGRPKLWDVYLTKHGIFVSKPEQTLAHEGEVLGAFGDGTERAIVYRDFGMAVHILRSHDAGAHWDKPERVSPGPYQPRAEKRGFAPQIDVVWWTGKDTSRWLVVDGTGPIGKPVDLPVTSPDDFCGTAAGLWWIDASREIKRLAFTEPKGATRVIGELSTDGQRIGACSADFVVVHAHRALRRCDRTRCDPQIDVGGRAFADVTAAGELQYVVPFGDLLVIGPGQGVAARVVKVDGVVHGAAAFYGGPLHVEVLHARGITQNPVYP